jgi:hypothetical protein
MRTAFALALALTTLTGCQEDDPFEEAAYFRGDNQNRVFVLTAPPGIQGGAILDHVETQMHTEGRFTAVFVYPSSATPPAQVQAVTLASNYQSAIDLLYSEGFTGWRWRFMRRPDGGTDWIDCARPGGQADICNLR